MRLKLLLLFLVVAGFSVFSKAQTTKPYTNLVITEAVTANPPDNYVEFTNMGNETIDLSNFEFGMITPWDNFWSAPKGSFFRLPKKTLAPGKSFLMATAMVFGPKMWLKDPTHYNERLTKPEMFKLADKLIYLHEPNSTAKDTVTNNYKTMDIIGGRDTWFLRHHFLNAEGAKDSVVVDQVGGVFDQVGGHNKDGAYDVAGVTNATKTCVLIRRASVKKGNTDFNKGRGIDLADSEWIPVPIIGAYDWRAIFWTAGNQATGAVLDANTLVSKTGKVKVDLNAGSITVPWGVRRNDSIMYQFQRKPGLAWSYALSKNYEDSAFISIRTGDKLTLYVCGDKATVKEFNLVVDAPTASDNIVVPKVSMNYKNMHFGAKLPGPGGYRVTDGVKGMDTISQVPYATRVDTLFKFLEKPVKASWKIVFKSGTAHPDLKFGDKLAVTSENGKVKEYFLKLQKFAPSNDAYLSSITWPDMPSAFKGDVAEYYGWKGDTIPGFLPSMKNYVVKIPLEYQGIPALTFTKQQLDSKVVVTRAKTLQGTPEDRTVKFTVTAENDTTVNVYSVRFEKDKDPENVQPYKGEPFFSQVIAAEWWGNPFLEITNPGTEPLDLSNYMLTCGYFGMNGFDLYNSTGNYKDAYRKYIPGKKWQSEAEWAVQPRIAIPDLNVNPIVYPGDVFVMTRHSGGDALTKYGKEVDVNFATGKNPWNFDMPGGTAVGDWLGCTYFFYKILNDSVKNGLKPATDRNDFQLLETFGHADNTDWVIGGVKVDVITSYFRKPNIYKPNPVVKGSFGKTLEDSEWTWTNWGTYQKLNYGWPESVISICNGLGSHIMDNVTIYRSTVSSKVYLVSPGYSKKETIKGLTTGTTVAEFNQNILKANEGQTLTFKSAVSGKLLAASDLIVKGDSLIVVSADQVNTSKYTMDVTPKGLSSNATLTSAKYTVAVTGAKGTISGIKPGDFLKNVVAGVTVPAGASLTMTDFNDAYMSLTKLTYDTTYVDVIATDKIFFEVIAEDAVTKIVYQLKPTVNTSDAYVNSDVYSVDQFASVINFIPPGTSVTSLLSNIYPAPGSTMVVYDKAGFVRLNGDVYKDDKLVVTAADGKTKKAYFFAMLNFHANSYMAFVISDDYQVEQVNRVITGPSFSTSIVEFKNKLYPSFGATLKVLNKSGVETKLTNIAKDDQLLVTALDGVSTALYSIADLTSSQSITGTSNIKMYPNPTDGRVIVQGLAKGNRVQVFNVAGVALRDVIVVHSTDYVSLEDQPKGIYLFVVSAGTQHLSIQKIVKK